MATKKTTSKKTATKKVVAKPAAKKTVAKKVDAAPELAPGRYNRQVRMAKPYKKPVKRMIPE